jgi:hypothetical protein
LVLPSNRTQRIFQRSIREAVTSFNPFCADSEQVEIPAFIQALFPEAVLNPF